MTRPVPERGASDARTTWVRREAEGGEAWLAGLVALAAGAAVGGTVLYFARMFLSRDELLLDAVPEEEGSRG